MSTLENHYPSVSASDNPGMRVWLVAAGVALLLGGWLGAAGSWTDASSAIRRYNTSCAGPGGDADCNELWSVQGSARSGIGLYAFLAGLGWGFAVAGSIPQSPLVVGRAPTLFRLGRAIMPVLGLLLGLWGWFVLAASSCVYYIRYATGQVCYGSARPLDGSLAIAAGAGGVVLALAAGLPSQSPEGASSERPVRPRRLTPYRTSQQRWVVVDRRPRKKVFK